MKRAVMTQDERWMIRYNEVKNFIETNHRNPSKYNNKEKLMVHFLKRDRKLMNAGELAEPRLGMFMELLALGSIEGRISMSEVMKNVLEGVWRFCRFMFWLK